MHSRACAYVHATVAYAHTFHIAHIIADGGCDRVWHIKLRRKGDSVQFLIVEGPKKLVKNWLNIDTWPGRLPGSGRSLFIPRK